MPELAPDPSPRLDRAFEAIAARMAGLGFVNSALRVEAVDFRPWQGRWLGVMVTPWCVNLMLLPQSPEAWESLPQGKTARHRFPAGDYDFISAHDETIGQYQMCSLFSPALEFADHATARLVAQLVLQALFDPANAPDEALDPADIDVPGPLARTLAAADAPLSKREFLRGGFLRGPDDGTRR